eukprot:2697599-Amphidinium_carterae.1
MLSSFFDIELGDSLSLSSSSCTSLFTSIFELVEHLSADSVPDNVVPYPRCDTCPSELSGQHADPPAYGGYYGDYVYYAYVPPRVCSCNSMCGSSSANSGCHQWFSQKPFGRSVFYGLSSVGLLLCLLFGLAHLLFRYGRDCQEGCGHCLAATRADLAVVGQAFCFLTSEVLMVCARRAPWCKQRVRRLALRLRPYVVTSVVTGEPVFVHSPLTTPRTPHRPLTEIQVAYRIVSGGTVRRSWVKCIRTARQVRRQRIVAHRSLHWRTTFNPSSAFGRGDCLFSSLSKIAGGKLSPLTMRQRIKSHAAQLLVSGDRVFHGKSLGELLVEQGLDITQYMSTLVSTRPRWGNTIDVLIAADALGIRLGIYDIRKHALLCDSGHPGVLRLIGYHRHHFVVGEVRQPRAFDVPGCAPMDEAWDAKVAPHVARTCLRASLLAFMVHGISLLASMLTSSTQEGLYRDFGQTHDHLIFQQGGAGRGHDTPHVHTFSSGSGWLGNGAALLMRGTRRPLNLGMRMGTPMLQGDFDQPFAARGTDDDGTSHAVINNHELALYAARHLEEAALHDEEDRQDRRRAASEHPICGEDDNRPLTQLLLGRVLKVLMSHTSVRYCWRGSSSPFTAPPSPPLSDFQEEDYCASSLGTSRRAQSELSAPSTPGDPVVSTPPSISTSLIVEGEETPRSPADLDGVEFWSRSRDIVLEDASYHSWGNPEFLSQIERDYVIWHAHMRRPLPQQHFVQHEGIGLLQPALPHPLIEEAYMREALVAPFRAYIRQHAMQAVEYDNPLDDVGIGGYDFVEGGCAIRSLAMNPVVLVCGGAPKRPYPFGPQFARLQAQAASATDVAEIERPPGSMPTVLTYHGSFAPFHEGHRECLVAAIRHLRLHRVHLTKVAVGFTTEQHIAQKTPDVKFSPVGIRASIVREMIQGVDDLKEVIVDDCTHTASEGLAQKSKDEMVKREHTEFYDHKEAKGLCIQRMALNVNSTN